MKVLFHLGHPAHFHLFKNTISHLKNHGHKIEITIKKKDVLDLLLKEAGFSYKYLMDSERGSGVFAIGAGLLKRDLELYNYVRKKRPNLMIGTSAEIAHIGKLTGIPSINVNEDDWNVIPLFSYMTYPFTTKLLAPECCNMGNWKKKSIQYNSYHELAYLHPKYFTPKRECVDFSSNGGKYFILRFAKLNAHHDFGKSGLSLNVSKKIIDLLKNYGNIYITSERELEPELEDYRIKTNPTNIHHVLAFADMYIGDSQTMAAEAAVLGTPSFRFNDFVGKIGYLEELEHKYNLTYGIRTSEPDSLYEEIKYFLSLPNIKDEWRERRNNMLKDKIDITAFMIWLIENYPKSIEVVNQNPEYQYRFRFDGR